MSRSYSADNTALLKILLHSAKYGSSSVNGILLGKVLQTHGDGGDPADASGKPAQGVSVAVYDVVPLGHSYVSLAPLLDIGLLQVSASCRCSEHVYSRVPYWPSLTIARCPD